MTTIRVRYHHEPEGWWADSPELQGFVASGRDLAEVRELVKDGVPFYLDDQRVELREEMANSAAAVVEFRLDNEHSIDVAPPGQATSAVRIKRLVTTFAPERTESVHPEAAYVA
jgi:predicted RNase H-like HicB family nuclease